ncbi:MAG: Stp1/IreP family PP2C-type Ser/Thr phosphatase [Acidimicrobiia bacterium]
MTIYLDIGQATDTGKVRDHNEDGFLIDPDLRLAAVADGIGGHRGGEVASATALDTLHASFIEHGGLRDAVIAANDAVIARADATPELRGMGTTLTAGVLGDDDTLLVGHVGDSRAYLVRDGELSRITTDHSLVEELIAAGELTEEEAERDPRRSMITRALGLEPGMVVDLYPVPLLPGDRVMFCSDGLTTMVGEDAIADVLGSEASPDAAAHRLVDAANAAGGVDNTTVVVLDALEAPVEVVDDGASGRGRRFGILRRRR